MGCKSGIYNKFLLIIIGSLLFGGTISWAMEHEPQSPLPLVSSSVSANSLAVGSVAHDGRLDTAWWASLDQDNAQAWLTLNFQTPVLPEIIELELAQGASGVLAIEYSQGSSWYPVPELKKIDLETVSSRLSFALPQWATPINALRLVLTSQKSGQAGGIAEVNILGTKPLFVPELLKSQRVTATGSREVEGTSLSFLVDGNTYTSWNAIPTENVVVTFEFASQVKINRLALYGELRNYTYLTWQYYLNGSWLNLPQSGLATSELLPASWNTCGEFELGINTTALRLVLEAGSVGEFAQGPGEIAIWGTNPTNVANASGWQRYVSGQRDLEVTSNQGTVTVPIMLPEGIQNIEQAKLVIVTKPQWSLPNLLGDFCLPVGIVRVNDELLSPLDGSFLSLGETWQREEYPLALDQLLGGANTISLTAYRGIRDFPFVVREVALELWLDNGRVQLLSPNSPFQTNKIKLDEADAEKSSFVTYEELCTLMTQYNLQFINNPVTDGRLTTFWEVQGQQTATLELKLATTSWPTHLALAFSDNRPQQLTVECFDGNGWQPVSGLIASDTAAFGPGWAVFSWTETGPVQKLRLVFQNVYEQKKLGGLCEVALFGDKENTGPPKITILAPSFGAEVKRDVEVRGLVDNPACQVMVAGVPAAVNGHVFQTQIRLHPDFNPAKRIEAVAIDSKAQLGSDSVIVYLNHKAPVMMITSPAEGLLTVEKTITVEGELGNNSIAVFINGIPVRSKGRSFTHSFVLKQGLNRIVIRGVDPSGAMTKVIRTVWYDPLPPQVSLDFPAQGALLQSSPGKICGRVSDFTPVTVTVNGVAATVSAGEFCLTDFQAQPGENAITIVATDALGNTTTLRSSFIYDDQAPQITVSSPDSGALFMASPIQITGTITDDLPAQVFVNKQPTVIEGNSFSCNYSLKEGSNILTIIAQDAAGNRTVVIFEVLLDTKAPEAFMPVLSPQSWTRAMPVVTFATEDATSGISYYELAIGDGDFMVASSPYQLPVLPDGEHTIKVRAFDLAGWSTIGEAKAYIDTTPPRSFSLTADPAGCTNNPEPLLSFSAEDDTSGIAYYTLAIDGGEPIRVSSPHRLAPLPDGERVLIVTAVDFAGLATNSEVRMIIDTIAPPVPEIVRVIPGPDNINIKWSASVDAHVTQYYVERNPAWNSGILVVDSLEIVDTDLLADEVYSYRIFALDRAANISPATQWHEGQLGLAKVEYLSEQGAIVEYENVALIVPKEALPEGYKEI